MSWRARWALPECSQTQSLTDFNEFGQQPLLVLAAWHIHMTGFYQHKALSKGSVSRLHTWAFPGSRVWNWAVQVLELAVHMCPFAWQAPTAWCPHLGSDAGVRTSKFSSRVLWEETISLERNKNGPGNGHAEPFWVARSCCWEHWLRMQKFALTLLTLSQCVKTVYQGHLWHISSWWRAQGCESFSYLIL